MKHLRRSTKSSNHENTSTPHTSLPIKDPSSIIPPKKVIKALYDYTPDPPNDLYLAFKQSDFLHVVDREDDPDWFMACNPIQGTRGFVPVNYFEIIGKNTRDSANQEQPPRNNQQLRNHDSGYSEKVAVTGYNGQQSNGRAVQGVPQSNAILRVQQEQEPRLSKTLGRGAGNMVYGAVMFDFKAERPDELEAHAGEYIIVIAISNPEWFVAKPIQRLGGPGLIPVSFIEIRDMGTGRTVEDPLEAVRRAGVPAVEEWKKMAAEYKNSSIPLGQLSHNQAQQLSNAVDRMSLTNGGRASHGRDQSQSYGESRSYQPGHSRAGSYSQPGGPYNGNQYRASYHNQPVWARVPRFCHQKDEYWFILEVHMQDGRYWDLCRNYKDFYGLQLTLKDTFPELAEEKPGQSRVLPYMPGPLPWVTDTITRERRAHLDKYINEVLANQTFANSVPVKNFFSPRDGDTETGPKDPNAIAEDTSSLGRPSSGSSQNDHRPPSNSSLNGPNGNASHVGTSYGQTSQNRYPPHHTSPNYQSGRPVQQGIQQRGSQSQQQQQQQQHIPGPMLRQNTNMSSYSNGSGHSGHAPGAPASNGQPVKIKVFFGSQNTVVIRLPAGFDFNDLMIKLRERWSMEPGVDKNNVQDTEFAIQYKDDMTGSFNDMLSQHDLDYAQTRTEKMTIRVHVL